jgi:hypothetical protein
MHRFSSSFAWVLGLLTVLIVGGPGATLVRTANPLEDEGMEALKKKWDRATEKDFRDFLRGINDPGEKDAKVIDTAAQWYAYRLTWPNIPNRRVVEDFVNLLREASNSKDKNKKFMNMFAPKAMQRLKDVIDKEGTEASDRQRRLNAAIMAHRLAELTGHPDVMDDMTAILLGAKYPEFVKVHVLKGVKELLDKYPTPADDAATKTRDTRYEKVIPELIKYVDAKPVYPANASREKKKEIDAKFLYFRREAVKALAHVHLPAVAINNKEKTVTGPVAYWLLKVLANQDLGLPASIGEQVEAAVGLFQLRPPEGSPYQADLALFYGARFIEKDLAQGFIEDPANDPGDKVLGEKSKGIKLIKLEPWKLHAARLAQALEDLAAFNKGKPGQKKAEDLMTKAKPLLAKMELRTRKDVDETSRNPLKSLWEGALKPTAFEVYKGFATYDLKAAAADE